MKIDTPVSTTRFLVYLQIYLKKMSKYGRFEDIRASEYERISEFRPIPKVGVESLPTDEVEPADTIEVPTEDVSVSDAKSDLLSFISDLTPATSFINESDKDEILQNTISAIDLVSESYDDVLDEGSLSDSEIDFGYQDDEDLSLLDQELAFGDDDLLGDEAEVEPEPEYYAEDLVDDEVDEELEPDYFNKNEVDEEPEPDYFDEGFSDDFVDDEDDTSINDIYLDDLVSSTETSSLDLGDEPSDEDLYGIIFSTTYVPSRPKFKYIPKVIKSQPAPRVSPKPVDVKPQTNLGKEVRRESEDFVTYCRRLVRVSESVAIEQFPPREVEDAVRSGKVMRRRGLLIFSHS